MDIQGRLFQGEGFRSWGDIRGYVEFPVGIRVWGRGVTLDSGAFCKWHKQKKGTVQLSWRAQDKVERLQGVAGMYPCSLPLQMEAWGEAGFLLSFFTGCTGCLLLPFGFSLVVVRRLLLVVVASLVEHGL